MAPHSSTLAWRIPWTEEPGRLQSMGSLRVGHDWVTSLWLFTFMHWRRKWQPTPVFLPRESQGWGSLVGCHLWECKWKLFQRGMGERLIISEQVMLGSFCSTWHACAQWLFLCITGLSGRPGMPYSRTDEERPQSNWITSVTTDCRLHHDQFFFGLYFTSPQYVSFVKFEKL